MANTVATVHLTIPLASRSALVHHYQDHALSLLPLHRCHRRRSALLHAARRFSNYPQEAVLVVPDPRAWVGDLGNREEEEDEDDDVDDEDDEDDRSLDLLARFLENLFRKISKRARRAVRSVLPSSISTKLVKFAVNGVLMLTFLWILKAFLEVVCTFGSMVFVSILIVRGVWAGISYLKGSGFYYSNRIDNDDSAWNNVQPAS